MRLSNCCYAVTGLAYQLPWVVNAGFIVGNEETLIVDTGANALAAATIHGYAEAARPMNRLRVVNTEQHFDHIGGNGFFRELDISIHGHPAIARTKAEFEDEKKSFHPAFHFATGVINPDQPLPAQFDLGGCIVDVVATPGHTPTNISLFVREDSILYCGDALTNLYAPNLDASGGPEGWRTWLASLDRIAQLEPAAIVCGHGPVVTPEDVPQVIATVRRAIERRLSASEA